MAAHAAAHAGAHAVKLCWRMQLACSWHAVTHNPRQLYVLQPAHARKPSNRQTKDNVFTTLVVSIQYQVVKESLYEVGGVC